MKYTTAAVLALGFATEALAGTSQLTTTSSSTTSSSTTTTSSSTSTSTSTSSSSTSTPSSSSSTYSNTNWSNFGKCTSSTCNSATPGLASGPGSWGAGASASGTAKDPKGTGSSSTTTTTTTTWGTWADPSKSKSASTSSSTAWEAWSADPAAPCAVGCATYVPNGDSWAFPACVGASPSGWSSGGKSKDNNSAFLSTIATNVYPTTVSQVSQTWEVVSTGVSSPSYATAITGISDNGCNTPEDRSSWCGGYSIDTNPYTSGPDTGVVCEYHWVISQILNNYDGDDVFALAVNGQVPGPAIECNWGDTIKVTVTNAMPDNATTIHWHGIRQVGTNDQDGVPGLTECGLAPGSTRVYEWKADSYGSSWYHSHFVTQYADGIYGPLIIKGPVSANYDVDMGPVLVSDL